MVGVSKQSWVTAIGVMVLPASFALPALGQGEPGIVADNSGSARWTIPVEVPPGPNGLAPKLAVVYSSSAGDGPFGVGWTLPLGEIACSVRHGVPTYVSGGPGSATCPQFELDGELLKYEGVVDGFPRYHTFVESFQRVLDKGYIGWEVTSPDGTVRRYGLNQNRQIRGPSGNIVRWLLSSIADPFGNTIEFSYDGDPGTPADLPVNGHTYIKRIDYGPHAERVVEFEYELRSDPIQDYAGGVERLIDYRATEIRVTSNGSTHSRYRLGYDLGDLGKAPTASWYSTARSRLSYVQRFGSTCSAEDLPGDCTVANGKALPPQEFRYTDPNDVGGTNWVSDGPGGFAAPPTSFDIDRPSWPTVWPANVRTADINGDGLVDIVDSGQFSATQTVWINTGTGFEQSSAWGTAFQSLRWAAPRVDVTLVNWGAYYGVCAATYSRVQSEVHFGDPKSWEGLPIHIEYEPGTLGETSYPPENPYVQLGGNFHLVDLNGDGLSDLVMSMRLSGIHRTHDCDTREVLPGGPELIEPSAIERTAQVVFRNTGNPETGWVEDPSLVQGLPLFALVMTDANYAVRQIWMQQGADHNPYCSGFLGPRFQSYAAYFLPVGVFPCIHYANFAPQFTDLNGDGRADLIVAVPDHDGHKLIVDNLIPDGQNGPYRESDVARTTSQAWLSRDDGRWEPDPSFDLPFHHAHIAFWNMEGSNAQSWATSTDAGVRIVDRNRDGYADVTWVNPFLDPDQFLCQHYSCWSSPPGYASQVRGVLLNRGAGDGTRYSAWCSSRPITDPDPDPSAEVALCSDANEARRLELPEREHFAVFHYGDPGSTFSEGTELADLNGDGWLDLVRAGRPDMFRLTQPTAFLFSREGTAWVEDHRFDPPTYLGAAYHDMGYWYQFISVNSRMLDLDGDGAVDFSHAADSRGVTGPEASWVGKRGLSDLLREVHTGHDGTIQIAYDTGPRQRDDNLEADATAHAAASGPTDLNRELLGQVGEAHWTVASVVASVTVEGPNRAPSTTGYRYADPRWDREQRIGLGWRLVEETRADQSVVASFFYQRHGRAGRLSKLLVEDGADEVFHRSEVWELPNSTSVGGSIAGVYVGRLESVTTSNRYPNGSGGYEEGAVTTRTVVYNDDYGYNFARRIVESRPTGTLRIERTPTGDSSLGIAGLVENEWQYEDASGTLLSQVHFDYDRGKVTRRSDLDRPRAGYAYSRWLETTFTYSSAGNLKTRTSLGPVSTEDPPRTTLFCYDGETGCVPGATIAGHNSQSLVVGIQDPLGHWTEIEYDPVFPAPTAIRSDYRDEPAITRAYDAFGRLESEFVTPAGGSAIQTSSIAYVDTTAPPYRIETQFVNPEQTSTIVTAIHDDGFGSTWKTVRKLDPDINGSDRFSGSAVFIDPVANTVRQTYDIECSGATTIHNACSGLTGGSASELPAETTRRDALGRIVRVDLPGNNLFSQTLYGADLGAGGDVAFTKDANGHLLRRTIDGDRLVRMEECNNTTSVETLDASTSCTAPDLTGYEYYASGELRMVLDPVAMGLGGNPSDPNHRLVYEYDTLGRAIRIDDPDAGTSHTTYDEAGNVASTLDARGMLRTYKYDALDRRRWIHTPDAVKDIEFTYSESPPEMQVYRERATAAGEYEYELYTKTQTYDALGRVYQILRWTSGSGTLITTFQQYDLLNRPLQIAYPIESSSFPITTRYEYAGAYLKRVCNPLSAGSTCTTGSYQSYLSNITYDELGRRSRMDLMGGQQEQQRTFEYENTRQLLVADKFGTSSSPYWVSRLFRQSSVTGQCSETGAPAYDGLGNLTKICATSGTTSTTPNLDFSAVYSYDDQRNRIKSWAPQGVPAPSFSYDKLGNLTFKEVPQSYFDDTVPGGTIRPHAIKRRVNQTYEYDDSGNIQKITTGGDAKFYKFDSANRLICIGSLLSNPCDEQTRDLKVDYDADGERLREVAGGVTKLFAGDDFESLSGSPRVSYVQVSAFGERVARATISGGRIRAAEAWPAGFQAPPWLWAVPVLTLSVLMAWYGARVSAVVIAMARRPGYTTLVLVLSATVAVPRPASACGGGGTTATITYNWILSDRIGSGIVEIDQTGQAIRQVLFAPFGKVLTETGSAVNDYFAGHPAASGFYQMKARWMNPETGTFLSVDPLIDTADPQRLNAYSYARNNPVSNVDPTGMDPLMEQFGLGTAAGVSSLMGNYGGLAALAAETNTYIPGVSTFVYGGILALPEVNIEGPRNIFGIDARQSQSGTQYADAEKKATTGEVDTTGTVDVLPSDMQTGMASPFVEAQVGGSPVRVGRAGATIRYGDTPGITVKVDNPKNIRIGTAIQPNQMISLEVGVMRDGEGVRFKPPAPIAPGESRIIFSSPAYGSYNIRVDVGAGGTKYSPFFVRALPPE